MAYSYVYNFTAPTETQTRSMGVKQLPVESTEKFDASKRTDALIDLQR